MALQYSRVQVTGDAVASMANEASALLAKINRVLEYNSDQAIDWGAGEKPAYIDEEANGNLSGRTYSRQAVANAIGSLNWIRSLLTNQVMTGSQGDHLGNLNQLASPLG